MAEGQTAGHRRWPWVDLFRTFQIALDPKKLFLAAAGLLVMSLGTWAISAAYFGMRSPPLQANYTASHYNTRDPNLTAEQAQQRANDAYQRDLDRYEFISELAGRGEPTAANPAQRRPGIFRVMPWHENRGDNPYLVVTGQTVAPSVPQGIWFWLKHDGLAVLAEPLVKFLQPVICLLSARADFPTRIYLLLIILWVLAVWAFFGGAITRIAVLQIADKDTPSMAEALRFVGSRYLHYLLAPLVPVLFIAGIVLIMIIFGLVHLIPGLGDLWDGILWPIPMLLGFAQALLLVGLVGYPLMFPTISAEGSDTFDALSRSYNYVYQSPWHYIWNCLVALVYGMAVVFFVVFMGSLVVYLTKWSLAQTPGTQVFATRRVDNLFLYAPTTFHWQDLLVDHEELKSYASDAQRTEYLSRDTAWYNQISAVLVGIWLTFVLLFVIGYSYSYFFCAATMVYLLMRRTVDDTDIDEVYAEDELPDEPLLPPGAAPAAPTGPQVQMVDAPTLRTPATDGAAAIPAAEKPPATP